MSPAIPNRSYYPSLDGLRGIAILCVISCHNYNFLPFFRFGWIGVDLFFVLSGFLITDILLKTKDHRNFLRNFYIRRSLRIFPLFYLFVILYFSIIPFLAEFHEQYIYFKQHWTMVWFHLINWLYIFHERPNHSLLLGHLWSLSLEEQFYFFWPFIFLIFKKIKHLALAVLLILLICIASRIFSWLYIESDYTNYTFQSMTRIDGLCIGSIIAIGRLQDKSSAQKKFLQFSGVVAVFFLSLAAFSKLTVIQIPYFRLLGYTMISVVFGIVTLIAIERKSRPARFLLESNILKYFGKISYSLYLFHWPVLVFCKMYIPEKLIQIDVSNTSSRFIVASLAFIISILASHLSYFLLEKRILELKDILTSEGFFPRLRQKLRESVFIRSAKQ